MKTIVLTPSAARDIDALPQDARDKCKLRFTDMP